MHKLIEYICDELEELEGKVGSGEKLSVAEIEYMSLLAESKKDLLKGEELMDGGYSGRGYSRRGYSRREGRESRDGRMYYDGRAYDGRSYERGRGGSSRRGSMGRYSNEYSMDTDSMVSELSEMMNEAPDERTRKEIQKLIDKIEMM
mgnify:CR=1 FL=1